MILAVSSRQKIIKYLSFYFILPRGVICLYSIVVLTFQVMQLQPNYIFLGQKVIYCNLIWHAIYFYMKRFREKFGNKILNRDTTCIHNKETKQLDILTFWHHSKKKKNLLLSVKTENKMYFFPTQKVTFIKWRYVKKGETLGTPAGLQESVTR